MSNITHGIIGAGPTGMTIAYILETIGESYTIFDPYPVGGCHRVMRDDGYFYEHSPRVISDNYKTMISILEHMGLDFHELYTKYNVGASDINERVISKLSWGEMFAIIRGFVSHNLGYVDNESLLSWMEYNNFSEAAIKALDDICRLSDGADSSRYPVSKFMNLLNQQALYDFYQPKLPNDEGLWNEWLKRLTGDIVKSKVLSMDGGENDERITLRTENAEYEFDKVFICVPPAHAKTFLKEDLHEWADLSDYNPHTSACFHFDEDYNYPQWGLTESPLGLVFIINSKYTHYRESRTVISCYVSKEIEGSDEEKLDIIFKELESVIGKLNKPKKRILNKLDDTAFVRAPGVKFVPPKINNNVQFVGSHNGASDYDFTSFETAAASAVAACNEWYDTPFTIKNAWGLWYVIVIFIIVIIILMYLVYVSYSSKNSYSSSFFGGSSK